MMRQKIGFIGGGNMGEALIASLLRQKIFQPSQIGLHEPDRERAKKIKSRFKLVLFQSNQELVQNTSIILLAVKPQHMSGVLQEIAPVLRTSHLVLTIAAGLDTKFFFKKLPPTTRLIRIMPNVCCLIGEGATALFAAPTAKASDRALASKIFSSCGKALFVEEEDLMDTVTALSGSGPAFVYLFIDSLIQAGENLGLDRKRGGELVLQTLLGATRMVESFSKYGEEIGEMIQKVASKGGTTEAGLEIMADRGFTPLIQETIFAAAQRAKKIRELA